MTLTQELCTLEARYADMIRALPTESDGGVEGHALNFRPDTPSKATALMEGQAAKSSGAVFGASVSNVETAGIKPCPSDINPENDGGRAGQSPLAALIPPTLSASRRSEPSDPSTEQKAA